MFSCFNRVIGLPAYVEKLHRPDLTLVKLREILEKDLNQVPEGSQLSVVVTDFRVDTGLTARQNCANLSSVVKLVSNHPRRHVIHFGQIFYSPKFCKLPNMSKDVPSPVPNFYKMFLEINSQIVKVMSSFGTGSAFGSRKKKTSGLTLSQHGWINCAWEGFIPGQPNSILMCESLTPEANNLRSIYLVKAIEGEIRTLLGK